MLHYHVIVIGSGAAGYAAADRLAQFGVQNIAVITENRTSGTSRNAGSDKQTYYKLSCTDLDSPQKMAEEMSSGGGMHKDTALIEAANSLRCFLHLADCGVKFPEDSFGRFVGYQTDHDTASRGTSIGPLTSRQMTECLEKRVLDNKDIRFVDHTTVLRIVTGQNRAVGVICLQRDKDGYSLVPVKADYIIMATGGAANIYSASVYPLSQSGALGLAIDAGCVLNNITEWQYGIASLNPRWNLSGSYQQVIPRYYSVDEDGNEFEFLPEFFENDIAACNAVFLKGYQWPFDSRKITGSSQVDLAVCAQTRKGYRVFMDFRQNPQGYDFCALSEEAKEYLINTGAIADTPYDRLLKMNPKAAAFYKDSGCDLSSEPLEIAVCAQHMNGGVDVDCNWQTSVENLFAAGEIAGTFGVSRPGGSALNSTQVGALRAAKYISQAVLPAPVDDAMLIEALRQEETYIEQCAATAVPMINYAEEMSNYAAFWRNFEQIEQLDEKLQEQLEKQYYHLHSQDYKGIRELYKYKDNLTAQSALCRSLLQVMTEVGSRGGAICYKDGKMLSENTLYREMAIHTKDGNVSYVPLRAIPDLRYTFETIWNESSKK